MNLDSWLETDHSDAERLQVAVSLCAAVDAAHRRGGVRLGLDPSGIEVEPAGSCRLGTDPPHTISPFAAPEVARGGEHTARSDVYTAGLICYTALARLSLPEAHPRPPLGQLRPDLPTDLTDALSACLEQDPEWRPADLSFVLSLLEPLAPPKPAPAARPAPAPKPPQTPQSPAPAAPRPAAPRASPAPRPMLQASVRQESRLPRVLAGVLGAAVVVAGAAWVWLNVGSPSAPRQTAGPALPSAPQSPPASPDATGELQVAAVGTTASPTPDPSPGGDAGLATPVPSTAPQASSPTPPAPSPSPSVPVALSTTPGPPPRPTARTTPPVPARPGPAAAAPPATSPDEPAAPGSAEAAAGPATISAVSPFQLRPGALQAIDVRGEGLTAAHVAYVTSLKKRDRVEGISATRHQLRGPGLLLVFLQVDTAVRPGRYALSLVGPDGSESNAYTIEVVKK